MKILYLYSEVMGYTVATLRALSQVKRSPLICSDVVGSVQQFLIDGLNGFRFKSQDIDSLIYQMLRVIDASDAILCDMSESSLCLAKRVTPTTSAANLLSLLSKNKHKEPMFCVE